MFLIAGSGRSGTSAVARLLHEAGISVGRDLIEADESNPEGYYEERRLVEINDCILRDAKLVEWFTYATREEVLAAAQPHMESMLALAADATPAWKDPRLSWTLEPWLQAIEGRPRIIVCLRSPDEVVASTMKYYGQVTDEARRAVLHVWRCQYERLLNVIAAYRLDAMSIDYGELHRDPEAAVAPLSTFAGRALDASLVRRDLRHHEREIPEDLRGLYERVRALGR